ncbi:hypothetical protein BGX29_006531 [Mortierella sp. GBA35]|nr:hypothetical protein BGX29_006531 [Mortierella sp. GBA35]
MKTTVILSLAVASAFSLVTASGFADADLHRVALDRVARTDNAERTGHQVKQALARYSLSPDQIQQLYRLPADATQQEESQSQDGQEQQQKGQQAQQSSFSAAVVVDNKDGNKEDSTKDTDKENVGTESQDQDNDDEDDGEDDDDDDEEDKVEEVDIKDEQDDEDEKDNDDQEEDLLEDNEVERQGSGERRNEVSSVEVAPSQSQPDSSSDSDSSSSSRRSKAIDSKRIPIEYNPSEIAFVGQVGICTPNQYFNLEFDIGSSDTWVTSSEAHCSTNRPCSSTTTTHRRGFHTEQSQTFEATPNISWHLELSDGPRVTGTLGTDVVQVGGFVVDRQVIAVADSLENVKENEIDGSFGLGLGDLSFNGDPTPVENLIRVTGMRLEVGVWLGRSNHGGELTFGGQDASCYQGNDLAYYNVPAGSAYWSAPIHSLTIVTEKSIQLNPSNNDTKQPQSQPQTPQTPQTKRTIDQVDSRMGSGTRISVPNVIFDTSTNIIPVPPRVAERTHRLIHDSFFGLYSGLPILTEILLLLLLPPPSPTPSLKLQDHLNNHHQQKPHLPPLSHHYPSTQPPAPAYPEPQFIEGEFIEGEFRSTSDGDINASFAGAPTSGGKWTSAKKFKVRGQGLVRERVPVIGGIFNLCFSGIQTSKNDEDDWVFGNISFMNNYMTLDHRRRPIGIAPAVQP